MLEIFIPFFREFPWNKECKWITPIACGNFKNPEILLNASTRDNINQLNPYYNEFATLYWVRNNLRLKKYSGFYHYRKYLDPNPPHKIGFACEYRVNNPTQEILARLTSDSCEAKILEILDSYEMIAPRPIISNISIKEQYIQHHSKYTWDAFETAIIESHPDQKKHIRYFSDSNLFHFYGCMITKSEIFIEYIDFVMPVLDNLIRTTPPKILDDENSRFRAHRYPAYLGERLFMLFMHLRGFKTWHAPTAILEAGA